MADFKVGDRQLRRLLRSLEDAAGTKGRRELVRATIDTSRRMRKVTGDEIVKVYNLGKRRISQGLRITKVDPEKLSFEIVGNNKPIVIEPGVYKAKQVRTRRTTRAQRTKLLAATGRASFGGRSAGVSLVVFKGKKRTVKPAFFGSAPNGKNLAFQRTGGAKRLPSKGFHAGSGFEREPIEPLVGPSIADHLLNDRVFKGISDEFVDVASEQVLNRITRLIVKGR